VSVAVAAATASLLTPLAAIERSNVPGGPTGLQGNATSAAPEEGVQWTRYVVYEASPYLRPIVPPAEERACEERLLGVPISPGFSTPVAAACGP
jgi:hypothetical protein